MGGGKPAVQVMTHKCSGDPVRIMLGVEAGMWGGDREACPHQPRGEHKIATSEPSFVYPVLLRPELACSS